LREFGAKVGEKFLSEHPFPSIIFEGVIMPQMGMRDWGVDHASRILERAEDRIASDRLGNDDYNIQRGKIPFDNYFGLVSYPNDARQILDGKQEARIHVFDLVGLEKLWEEREGIFIPKDGAMISLSPESSLHYNDTGAYPPFAIILTNSSKQRQILERARRGVLRDLGFFDGEAWYSVPITSNHLFYSEPPRGIEGIALSVPGQLREDFRGNTEKIKSFFYSLEQKERH